MSGWIKWEKDLETDPRTIRIVAALKRNAGALHGVTLVCGALIRLWSYADSHIRADNTLDMGKEQVDAWLDIPGFCDFLPSCWFQVIDENTVELPDFLAHNGIEAKKKALTGKRVENFRKRNSVTDGNAGALPDQTRPDQTRPEEQEPRSPNSDFKPAESETLIRTRVDRIRKKFPECARPDWISGEKSLRNARLAGAEWDDLEAGTERYAAYCIATGRIPTPAGKFFAASDKPWALSWAIPAAKAFCKPQSASPNKAAAWAEARQLANSIGFRDPHDRETVEAYTSQLKLYESRPRRAPPAIADLSTKMRVSK